MPSEEISPHVVKEIDENLRKAYEELLNEELPDRFQQLLQKLRVKGGEPGTALDDDGNDDGDAG